ncbi:predicted protein [Sclerotinia sclerotiorum 1980 UF-70]|uniref:Uncharacterized protein n=1 Tax=Sclerotinia sclerotiorum (strain ATCC 18683 / 1980 / Ss-1) TaxID=665079 RepID=A7EQY1_SCLS1|nr:predicted protein [Sclerotinia sclerotiorum 1980 UF-70]EDN91873.1 predicted protein [Sclerotinia sclerotiorum 1980 UF-70]
MIFDVSPARGSNKDRVICFREEKGIEGQVVIGGVDEREIQIGIKINEFVIEYGMEVNRAIVSVKLFWRRGRGGKVDIVVQLDEEVLQ